MAESPNQVSDTPTQNDPAVAFLAALQPSDSGVRRRAFAALLRAVARETQPR